MQNLDWHTCFALKDLTNFSNIHNQGIDIDIDMVERVEKLAKNVITVCAVINSE